MNKTREHDVGIVVEGVEDISPHNKALYEAGKALLVQSVEVGREFCKFMTTTSLGAIPVYLALLKLVLPKDYSLQGYDETLFLTPAFMFLVAAIIFVFGYFPRKGSLSLDLPAEIERERGVTIARRQRYATWGFLFLCVGVVVASWVLVARLVP